MKINKLIFACGLAVMSSTAIAGSVNTLDDGPDLILSGGVASGLFFSTHSTNGDTQNLLISDALLDISSQPIEIEPIDFSIGIGTLSQTKLIGAAGTSEQAEMGLQYAKIKYSAFERLIIETGIIETNIGYETSASFNNAHATQGIVKSLQPTYYPAIRSTFLMGDINLFGEVSQPFAFTVGVNGKIEDSEFELNYYDENDGKSIIDMVYSSSVGRFKYAFNFNFVLLDIKIANNDDTAKAFSIYASADIARMTIPIRLEYISDGTSQIYAVTPGASSFGSGFTFTASPTFNVSKSGYVRTEFSMVFAGNTILKNSQGVGQRSAISGAFQMGYRF